MNTNELERLAREATPGPWVIERGSIAWMIRERPGGPQVGNVICVEDATYIAATSPDVILALLEERRVLREALAGAGSVLMLTVTNVPDDGERPHWCRFGPPRHDATCQGMLHVQDALRAALQAEPSRAEEGAS